MANVKIALDKRRVKQDGSYPIVVEVWNINKIRISTGYSSILKHWEEGQFNKLESNHIRKNIVLRDIQNKAERFIIGLDENNRNISDKELRENLTLIVSGKGKKKEEKNFIYYLDEFIATKSKKGTIDIYKTTRQKLTAFDEECTFQTMDKVWLTKFEKWMADSGMKINAYAIHLRNIRAVFNYAIDFEYTTLYPFRKFKIKQEKTRKRALTLEQLITLRDHPCEEYQVKYRDMFMLMFYMIGVNAVDLFLAKHNAICNGRFEYKRAKTGKWYSIKLEPEMVNILEKYKGQNYLLDIMDVYSNYEDFLHRMGIALKQIGTVERKGLGGKKIRQPLFPELSSYWSRHTWATVANNLEIPKEIISEALGHEIGSPVTSIYIDFDRKKIDEANRKVLDHLLSIRSVSES